MGKPGAGLMDRFSEWFAKPYVALGSLAFGMAVIPVNDALIKLLADHMSLGQIVAIRSLLSLCIILLFSDGLARMMRLKASAFWQFTGRGMCLVVAMLLFFSALGSLPLATAVAIFFVSPLMITLLSVPLLGETIGIHRILSVIAGQVGAGSRIRTSTCYFRTAGRIVILVTHIWG